MDRVAQLLATEDEWRGALRATAGMLVGAGLVVLFLRRWAFDPWSDLALLALVAGTCALLYGTGMLGARAVARPHPWQAVFMLFGALVLPLALFQLVTTIGGDAGASLNVAWVFALTALAAAATARAGVRYGLFLAALAAIVAWLALWGELLAEGIFDEIGAMRLLLMVIGIALVALGAAARLFGGPDGPARANELLTGAAVAAVGAGAISFHAYLGRSAVLPDLGVEPTLFWDAYLLAVSLVAVVGAIALRVRGLAYAGAVGLAVFVFVVGFDLGDASPSADLVGWPLALLGAGVVAFLASVIRLIEEPEDEAEGAAGPEGDAGSEPGDGSEPEPEAPAG